MKEKKNKVIDSLYVFLTYSKTPNIWSKEYVLQQLLEKFSYKIKTKEKSKYESKIIAYIIAEELHQGAIGEGEYERGKHYHCYIELDKRTQIRDMRYLDIDGIHGNYQGVRNKLKVIGYCRKYGNYIEKGFPGVDRKELLIAKDEMDFKGMLFDKMSNREKVEFYRDLHLIKIRQIEIEVPSYAFQEEIIKRLRIGGYGDMRFTGGRPLGILMYGEPESGKTSFAYRLAKELGEKVIVIDDLKELEHYSDEGILLFDEITEEKMKENDGFFKKVITEIQARTKPYYGSKLLRWPRIVLFATNNDVKGWKLDIGIRSRLLVIKTSKGGDFKYQRYNEKGNLIEVEDF